MIVKTKLTLICLLFLALKPFAQPLVKNGSFENWNSFKSKLYPAGWYFDSIYIDKNFIKQVSDGTQGNYAILLGSIDNVGGPKIIQSDTLLSIPTKLVFDYKISGSSTRPCTLIVQISFFEKNKTFMELNIRSYKGYSSNFKTAEIAFYPKSIAGFYQVSFQLNSNFANSDDAVTIDNVKLFNSSNSNIPVEKRDIKIYPNPAGNLIFIENSFHNIIDKVKLISIEGVVSELTLKNSTIDVSEFNNGIYVLELFDCNQTLIKREKLSLID